MKKFLLRLVPFALLIAGVCVLCVVIDPFNVFHVQNIRGNGVEPNKNYIKMSYILKNPDKFNAYAFGSSRVGYIHFQDVEDVRCYNMTSDGATPGETLGNLTTLIGRGVIPRRVYLGVDSLSYTEDAEAHKKAPVFAPYEYLTENPLGFITYYCDPAIVGSAVFEVMLSSEPSYKGRNEAFYEHGSMTGPESAPTSFTEDKLTSSVGSICDPEGTLEDIRALRELCGEAGVELVVFVNPMNHKTMDESITRLRYYDFLRGLAEICPYYNFSGYSERSLACFFHDPSHFCSETGDLMLACMTKGETDGELYARGFGWYVTAENVGQLIEIMETDRINF